MVSICPVWVIGSFFSVVTKIYLEFFTMALVYVSHIQTTSLVMSPLILSYQGKVVDREVAWFVVDTRVARAPSGVVDSRMVDSRMIDSRMIDSFRSPSIFLWLLNFLQSLNLICFL